MTDDVKRWYRHQNGCLYYEEVSYRFKNPRVKVKPAKLHQIPQAYENDEGILVPYELGTCIPLKSKTRTKPITIIKSHHGNP